MNEGHGSVAALGAINLAAVAVAVAAFLASCATTPHPPPCAQGQVLEIVPATAYQAPGACGPGKVAVYGPVFHVEPLSGLAFRASDEPAACVEVAAGYEGRCW